MNCINNKIICFLTFALFPLFLASSNQIEDEQSFYLSNYTNYSAGQTMFVDLYSSKDKGDFQFRFLKINDSVNLLKEIKRRQNSGNQFDIWGAKDSHILKWTEEIKKWEVNTSASQYKWNSQKIEIGKVRKTGIYIVQAIQGDQVAYCPIIVSNTSLVYKTAGNHIVAFLAEAESGKFVNSSKISLYLDADLIHTSEGDKNGIHSFKVDTSKMRSENPVMMIGETENEVVFSHPQVFFSGYGHSKARGYIYTNQPVYRPGQKVNFKGIIRLHDANNLLPLAGKDVNVIIRSPKNKEVYNKGLTTNEFGSVWSDFNLDEEADLGAYSITINHGESYFYSSFEVEEYKKPEFKVTVSTSKKNYTRKDIIRGNVKSDYYFGSPVAEASVSVKIYKQQFWLPWWYWSEYNWFYKSFWGNINQVGNYKQFVNQIDGKLDSKGSFNFSFEINEGEENDFNYEFVAEVTDNSRRTISGSESVFVTRGAFTLTSTTDQYFLKIGRSIKLIVSAHDFERKPVETNFKIKINKIKGNQRAEETVATLEGKTDSKGRASTSYLPTSSGEYRYSCIAKDAQGNEIIAYGSFSVQDKHNPYYSNYGRGLEIQLNKEAYEAGDTLSAVILFPDENNEVLLTYESNSAIHHIEKIKVIGNSFELTRIIDDSHSPSFNISVVYVKNKQLFNASKTVPVIPSSKILSVDIYPNKNVFKPGEEAKYLVRVKDSNGNLLPNTELSLGMVDESIYAIKDEIAQPIQDFFFAPQHSNVPVYSTAGGYSYSGRGRYNTLLDKNYFLPKGDLRQTKPLQKGSESVIGKLFGLDGKSIITTPVNILFINESEIYQAVSDTSGMFILNNLPKGKYDVGYMNHYFGFKFIKQIEIKEGQNQFEFEIEQPEVPEMLFSIREGRATAESIQSTAVNGRTMEKGAVDANGSGELKKAEVRSEFSDAPIWLPNIITNNEGEAEIILKLPDNLTTWRTTVRAISKETKAGQSVNTVIARKNLLVRIETPRFLRQGDKHFITTNIHNYLKEKKKVQIQFKADELNIIAAHIDNAIYYKKVGNNKYESFIEPNSELRIDWEIEVTKPIGNVELYVEALTNEESDAVRINLPAYPNGIKQITPINIVVDNNETENELEFTVPNIDMRTASLSFTVQPSIAVKILKSLDDLIQYPYGCVEQTMSRFLPAVIASNTFKQLEIPVSSSSLKKIPEVVDAGLKRLYSFAHADGGWGWWKNDKSDLFMTAYVVNGLLEAKNGGCQIDEKYIVNGSNRLWKQIEDLSQLEKVTYSYLLYVLSKDENFANKHKGELIDKLNKLAGNNLDAYSLSLAGLAYHSLGGAKQSRGIAVRLIETVYQDANVAYWKSGDARLYAWQNDEVQTSAYALKFLLKEDFQNPLIKKIVRRLIHQQKGFSWNSTMQTAKVIFALTDYLKLSKELQPDYAAVIKLNGTEIFKKSFNKNNLFDEPLVIELNEKQRSLLSKGKNKISISKSGAGTLYFSGKNQFYIKEAENKFAEHFKISREMWRLIPEGSPQQVVHKKKNIRSRVNSQDIVFVKVSVDFLDESNQYVMIEDYLPAGFEVVKDESHYNILDEPGYHRNYDDYRVVGRRPWIWRYADKEVRDEKITFFVTYPSSKMEFTYLLRAQIPGNYSVMPPEVSLMYYPEIMETGKKSAIVIDEK